MTQHVNSSPTIYIPGARSNIVTEFKGEEGHKIEGQDMVLAKRAADLLDKHYPGHLWAVNVNSEGGVMLIRNYAISYIYAMVLHLKNVYQDPQLKRVVMAGGEFLERAHLKRGRDQGDTVRILEGAAKKHQPRNGIIF